MIERKNMKQHETQKAPYINKMKSIFPTGKSGGVDVYFANIRES